MIIEPRLKIEYEEPQYIFFFFHKKTRMEENKWK